MKFESSQPDIPGLEQSMLQLQPAIFTWVVIDLEMTFWSVGLLWLLSQNQVCLVD